MSGDPTSVSVPDACSDAAGRLDVQDFARARKWDAGMKVRAGERFSITYQAGSAGLDNLLR